MEDLDLLSKEIEKLEKEATKGDEDLNFTDIDDDLQTFQDNEVVKEALLKGVDLRSYSKKLDQELGELESESIGDYAREVGNVVSLYTEIQDCETVLDSLKGMLKGFQNDLSSISDEIRHLQDHSLGMSIKMRNRQAVQKPLQSFLNIVGLPPSLVHTLSSGNPGSPEYLAGVESLSTKLKLITTGADDPLLQENGLPIPPAVTASASEVMPELEKLRIAVARHSRKFLVQQMQQLKQPNTNVQILQSTLLMKFKQLMHFLLEHVPDTANEVIQVYIQIMSKKIHTMFRGYNSTLGKYCIPSAKKGDLLVPPSGVKSVPAPASRRRSMRATSNDGDMRRSMDEKVVVLSPFEQRLKILDQTHSPPLTVHEVKAVGNKLPFEVLFRSEQQLLMDCSTAEYEFSRAFFGTSHPVYTHVLARSISTELGNLETLLLQSYDPVTILLLILISNGQRLLMQRRRVPCLDAYFDRISMMLWPRLKSILDHSHKSLQEVSVKSLGKINFFEAHPLVSRFADYCASIAVLHAKLELSSSMIDSMLPQNLELLRVEMERVLQLMAAHHATSKAQSVFLINNYHSIVTVFEELGVSSADHARFRDLLDQQVGLFIDEELSSSFGGIIRFVQKAEASAGEGGTVAVVDEAECESLGREFSSNWKQGIDTVNGSVLTYFSDFKNGTEVLKTVLTQLLLYYTRFQDIVRKCLHPDSRAVASLVPISQIYDEIKCYGRNF